MSTDSLTGRRVVLRRRIEGPMDPSDFAVDSYSAPTLNDGEFIVRTRFISVDPMIRLYIDPAFMGAGMPAFPLGTAAIPGAAVGEVIDSRHADFKVGDLVEGRFGWQDYAKSNGAGVNRVNPALGGAEHALGIAGLPGFTAYIGLNVAQLKPGETLLVSGAAGAVGSVVGPLAHARGVRVVGIASGEAKRLYLMEKAGYAAVADRTAPDFLEQLKAALPQGANVYFDNVGGPMMATVMPFMARGGLVLVCGLMSIYEKTPASSTDDLAIVQRAVMRGVRLQGFTQYGQEAQRPAFEAELAKLVAARAVPMDLHIEEGLERLPHALWGLFNKSVAGKVIVRNGQQ
jgi:NADPH-dependent curcumin reductase CurA